MQNIGVVCDISWDNYILINNKFKKINPEYHRLNALYGKTLEIFNNCSSNNSLTLIRHSSDNLCKIIYNLLTTCDMWIIFSNLIEYNTQSRLVIDKCEEYNIKYIIVSEFSRNNDYYSFNIDNNISFKKILLKIDKIALEKKIEEFDYDVYNRNFNRNVNISISLSHDIKSKIKQTYSTINQNRKEKSIKLLYDKDEMKRERNIKKTIKEITQLDFNQNKLNYYKNIK